MITTTLAATTVCAVCGTEKERRGPSLAGPYCSRACYGISKRVDPVDYFWKHVKRGPDWRSCWLWIGERNQSTGYGQIPRSFKKRGAFGAEIKAHRVSWLLAHGSIPDGLRVLHHCDNPPCVRPDHLFLGTPKDNAADRDNKGRGDAPRGARSSGAKLTPQAVRQLRARHAAGAKTTALMALYGLSFSQVRRIVLHECWGHV